MAATLEKVISSGSSKTTFGPSTPVVCQHTTTKETTKTWNVIRRSKRPTKISRTFSNFRRSTISPGATFSSLRRKSSCAGEKAGNPSSEHDQQKQRNRSDDCRAIPVLCCSQIHIQWSSPSKSKSFVQQIYQNREQQLHSCSPRVK